MTVIAYKKNSPVTGNDKSPNFLQYLQCIQQIYVYVLYNASAYICVLFVQWPTVTNGLRAYFGLMALLNKGSINQSINGFIAVWLKTDK